MLVLAMTLYLKYGVRTSLSQFFPSMRSIGLINYSTSMIA
jgi:hypothetical protein